MLQRYKIQYSVGDVIFCLFQKHHSRQHSKTEKNKRSSECHLSVLEIFKTCHLSVLKQKTLYLQPYRFIQQAISWQAFTSIQDDTPTHRTSPSHGMENTSTEGAIQTPRIFYILGTGSISIEEGTQTPRISYTPTTGNTFIEDAIQTRQIFYILGMGNISIEEGTQTPRISYTPTMESTCIKGVIPTLQTSYLLSMA